MEAVLGVVFDMASSSEYLFIHMVGCCIEFSDWLTDGMLATDADCGGCTIRYGFG